MKVLFLSEYENILIIDAFNVCFPVLLLLIQFLPYWVMVTEAQFSVARESNPQRCFPVVSSQAYSVVMCVCVY